MFNLKKKLKDLSGSWLCIFGQTSSLHKDRNSGRPDSPSDCQALHWRVYLLLGLLCTFLYCSFHVGSLLKNLDLQKLFVKFLLTSKWLCSNILHNLNIFWKKKKQEEKDIKMWFYVLLIQNYCFFFSSNFIFASFIYFF